MIDVVMPQMGESLTEGTVTHWFKAVGDRVEKDEAILEIETDKVNTEVEALTGGVLSEILVHEGETVPVGSPLGRISVDDTAEPVAAPSGAHFGGQGDVEVLSFRRPSGQKAPASSPGGSSAADASTTQVRFSPAVLELADRSGVSRKVLESVPGSGAHGRVSKRDLEKWLNERGNDSTSDAAPVAAGATAEGEEFPAAFRYSPTPRVCAGLECSATRRSIAGHMLWSQRISAQATVSDEMDVSSELLVDRDKEKFRERVGAGLTYTAVIGYAIVQTLAEYPLLNCAVVGDEIIRRPYVHLGLAVAIEEGRELIVPVIDDADQLTFDVFARRVEDVTVRARERRLERRELSGGTFTYSNPGMAGGTSVRRSSTSLRWPFCRPLRSERGHGS